MWEFYGILCFSGHGRYVLGMRDEWPFTRVSRSLSYPSFHHWWYDFPLLYWYGLIIIHSTFSLPSFVCHHLFSDLCLTFYPFPTYWYTFPIRYLFHIIHMFHWWFDYSSFLSFHHWHFLWLPLDPWLMRFFLCITSYHWVFEPSFPSFLSPYHPSLRYVSCLKTTLRPRDQMLSLIVFTWTGLYRLVEV